MAQHSHRRFYLSIALVAILVVVAQVGAYYYLEKSYGNVGSTSQDSCDYLTRGVSSTAGVIAVNTLINYGNGTMKWYNETSIPAFWSFYQLTLYIARCNVSAQVYGPPLNEHYVTGINGVTNQGHWYWTLWVGCQNSAWTVAKVGADSLRLSNRQTLAWAYEMLSSPNPTEPPEPGFGVTDSCG